MAELNNRKRKLSTEDDNIEEFPEESAKKQNIDENDPVANDEVQSDSDTKTYTVPKTDDTPLLSKSVVKSFSRFLPRNVVGTIGRKTTVLAKRTLRTGKDSVKTPRQGQNWDTISTLSSSVNFDNTQADSTRKHNQTLHKYYTLKLRKLKEKFNTKRQRKDRFRFNQTAYHDRFRKELNQSRAENNKQNKILEELLEKHNKHLESL